MKSLADYLLDLGWRVTGSDLSSHPNDLREFQRRQLTVYGHHASEHVPPETDLVIYSLAVPENNPEREEARRLGKPELSYVEMLGRLMQQSAGLGVAGTHGKTTTTTLLSWLLRSSGREPALLCGGRACGEQVFGRAGKEDLLVAECCEFRRSFHFMFPERAALLNVEPDHFDCYPDEASLLDGFSKFCGNVKPTGLLVVNAASSLALQAASSANCRVACLIVETTNEAAAKVEADVRKFMEQRNSSQFPVEIWRGSNIRQSPAGTEFLLTCDRPLRSENPSEKIEPGLNEPVQFQMPLYGLHQVTNAISALLLARSVGVSEEKLQAGLKTFPGVERRFQDRGSYRGWRLADDYAHHPSEILAVIGAARQKYPQSKLTVAFQPHQILRTQKLLTEFSSALTKADHVLLLPIYAARENNDVRIRQTTEALLAELNRLQPVCEFCPSLDHLRQFLDDSTFTDLVENQPLFLTLGAGDIDRIFYELPR